MSVSPEEMTHRIDGAAEYLAIRFPRRDTSEFDDLVSLLAFGLVSEGTPEALGTDAEWDTLSFVRVRLRTRTDAVRRRQLLEQRDPERDRGIFDAWQPALHRFHETRLSLRSFEEQREAERVAAAGAARREQAAATARRHAEVAEQQQRAAEHRKRDRAEAERMVELRRAQAARDEAEQRAQLEREAAERAAQHAAERAEREREEAERRTRWLARPAPAPDPQPFGVSNEGAEHLTAAWMRHLGVIDAEVTRYAGDGGIDVVSAGFIAQVKNFAGSVPVADVRALYGVAAADGKDALLFTSGNITTEGLVFADRVGIALLRYDAVGGTLAGINDLGCSVVEHGIPDAFARGDQTA